MGDCIGNDSAFHFTIISLTPDGIERWVYQYPDSSVGNEICYGADGNIYAIGSTQPQRKILVVSVDRTGSERWHYIYPTPCGEGDPGMAIVYGLDGNIYVAGQSGPQDNTDVTVVSITPGGSERWVYLYNGPGNFLDYGNDIIYAPDGNLYLFGCTCYWDYPNPTYWHGLVISLSNSGGDRWIYIDDSHLRWFTQGVYGADGNLYIAGDFGWDICYLLVESISDSGTYRWDYKDSTWGWASSIAYGGDGDIYVGGKTSISGLPDTSYFTVMKFAPGGELLWTYQYPTTGDWFTAANAVVYGLDGNIYAAGVTSDSLTGSDFTVISLSPSGIEEGERLKVKGERLRLGVSLNIVRNNARIQYTIPERQRISLKLYDIIGRGVLVIADRIVDAGVYSHSLNTSNFSSGIYFLILEGEKEHKIEKILIVK